MSGAKIIESDEQRRYVVVSAPGKRFSGDIKVTDLLYKCSDEFEAGNIAAFKETFEKIRVRFMNIEAEIGKDLNIKAGLDEAENEILSGAGRDYCASRGEFLAAKIMAAVLGVPFVDATEFVRSCIKEIVETLALTFFLVVLVCYIFLQDWRATLIPCLTIPVSLCSTFILMAVFIMKGILSFLLTGFLKKIRNVWHVGLTVSHSTGHSAIPMGTSGSLSAVLPVNRFTTF